MELRLSGWISGKQEAGSTRLFRQCWSSSLIAHGMPASSIQTIFLDPIKWTEILLGWVEINTLLECCQGLIETNTKYRVMLSILLAIISHVESGIAFFQCYDCFLS